MCKRMVCLITVVILLGLVGNTAVGGELLQSYTDPSYYFDLEFGQKSHWYQAWRSYLETAPAQHFLDGVGICGTGDGAVNQDLMFHHYNKYGMGTARIEIGWSSLDYDTETLNSTAMANFFTACKDWGIRPIVLLNGHHGAPCPVKFTDRTATSDAPVGSTQVTLNDVSGLIVGYSGINSFTDYWAAKHLIIAINGNTVTISQPLDGAINSSDTVHLAILKYRPFAFGTVEYNETIAGWNNYQQAIRDFAVQYLGTAGQEDMGFDLEVWNELTFGSMFLDIDNYYEPDLYPNNNDAPWQAIVNDSCAYADAHPDDFKGVRYENGFANTIPWPASSQQPDRVIAIGKHYYAKGADYPDDTGGNWFNAYGQSDISWHPTYSVRACPEYWATWLQCEHLIWDGGPFNRNSHGADRGRYARGTNKPCWHSSTECGTCPVEWGISDPTDCLSLKAKVVTRYYTLFLNKTHHRVCPYNTDGGDTCFGMVLDSFVEYTKNNTTYPSDDSGYVSPTLLWTGRIVNKMKEGGVDQSLSWFNTRVITVDSVSDTHDNYIFQGNTADDGPHPNLYHRDCLAILPYQVNSSRFVIPYYVITRDLIADLAPEEFTIKLSGINGANCSIEVYDPKNDSYPSFQQLSGTNNSVELKLPATDYPYLLIIEESTPALRDPDNPANAVNGLDYIYYEGTWDNLPDFDLLTPVEEGTSTNFDVSSPLRDDEFGFVFEGYIDAPSDGVYTFYTTSDDGSKLYIGSQEIVNNDGLHGMQEASGQIGLKTGRHAIKVAMFEKNGGHGLEVRWEGPGISKQLIPDSALYRTGKILREWWEGISGTAISDLTSDVNYPDNPTGSNRLSSFEAPTNWADNYGTRIRAYVHPPADGDYTFWIAGDDNCELWLSTDDNPANASLIANVPGWTNSREWTKYAEQQSSAISLTGGQKYYIEALHKEGGGGDNLAVAWQGPGISQEVIDGSYLSPWIAGGDTTPPAAPTGLSATAGDATVSLDWADNTEPDLAGYDVYRSTNTGGPYDVIAADVTPSAYTDNTVVNGTTYYYVVTAVDTSNNESGYSSEASATPEAAPGLPSPWQNQDVGTPGAAGSASYSAGTFTINGSGNDIWDTSDNFHLVYQSLSGDCEIVACVVSLENTDAWAKSGVMIRETLTAGSKHAMMVVTPGSGTSFQRRTTTDGGSEHTTPGDGITAPYWVNMVRSGDTFTGYKSGNGSDWVSVGSATISMASDVYVGMPVTSHSDGVLCTAEIDNVNVTTGGDTTPPAAPTGLTATPGDAQVSLDWADNTEPDLAGYNIYRSTTPGGGYSQVNGSLLSSSDYTDNSVSNGTTYYYVVTAVDTSSNESGYSNEASATPTGGGSVVVFSDSFENGEWNGLWSEDSQRDWYDSTQRSVDGSYSAEVDGSASDAALTSILIDLQGKTNATVTFSWFIEVQLDSGEYLAFDVSTNGGSTWIERAILQGNIDEENIWHNPSIDVTGISGGFQIRFRAKMSRSNEDANVDMVEVLAW